jgi:membrane associated rhomboid family serine protease
LSVPEVPERAPPGRLARMPRVVTGLVLVLVGVQALMSLGGTGVQQSVLEHFAVIPARIDALAFDAAYPEIAMALVGHALLHGGWFHLFFNAMILLMAGEVVAERYGRDAGGVLRFLALFAGTAAAGALTYLALNPGSQGAMVGASGAACGLFAGYLMGLRADWRLAFRDRAVIQAGAFFLLANVGLAAAVRAWGVFPIAWEAHLGGFIAGMIGYPLLLPRQRPDVW